MVLGILVILYSGIIGIINGFTYASIGLLLFELIVLIANDWTCPLTNVAKRVKPNWQNGDDIYLPQWLAIRNKEIFGSLLVVGLLLVAFRLVT